MRLCLFLLLIILHACGGNEEKEINFKELNSPCDCATALSGISSKMYSELERQENTEAEMRDRGAYTLLEQEYNKLMNLCQNKFDLSDMHECANFPE